MDTYNYLQVARDFLGLLIPDLICCALGVKRARLEGSSPVGARTIAAAGGCRRNGGGNGSRVTQAGLPAHAAGSRPRAAFFVASLIHVPLGPTSVTWCSTGCWGWCWGGRPSRSYWWPWFCRRFSSRSAGRLPWA